MSELIAADPGPAPAPLPSRARRERIRAQVTESSWKPVDLTAALDGHGQSPPVLLPRTDDVCLIYGEGKIHDFAAPPESCKGWLLLYASLEPLRAGYTIVYLDFEAGPSEVVERLRALGVSDERIKAQFVYIAPHEPLTDRRWLDAALARKPALVVIDGVTEALTLHGLDLNDNADVAKWLELLPRPAARSGASVALLDHVVKDRESRGAYSLGAQHKLAGVDVAYSLKVEEPFGRGREGRVKIRVRKDRPGHVRASAEGEDVATMRLVSDEDTGAVTVTLEPPEVQGDFRPTTLMERLSDAIKVTPGMSKREVRGAIPGKIAAKETALRLLVAEEYVEVRAEGQARRHYLLKSYRAIDDPEVVSPLVG